MQDSLESALSGFSLQDVIAKNPAVLKLIDIETSDSGVMQGAVRGILTKWALCQEMNKEWSKSIRDIAILLIGLRDNAEFIKGFVEEYGESPATGSAMDGIRYGCEYFTDEKLASSYPILFNDAQRRKRAYQTALDEYKSACETEDEEDCKEILDLFNSMPDEMGVQAEIANLRKHLEELKKAHDADRKDGIEKLYVWQRQKMTKMNDYMASIVVQAEKVRDKEILLDHWCVVVTDLLQEGWVVGGIKRQRFSESKSLISEKEFIGESSLIPNPLRMHYSLENAETEKVESDIEAKLRHYFPFVKSVEAFLNALDNLDCFNSLTSELLKFKDFNLAKRLLSLCDCFNNTEVTNWRNLLLEATSDNVYNQVCGEMLSKSSDPLIVAKAKEIQLCGELIASGQVVFCAKVLSPQFSTVFNHTIFERGADTRSCRKVHGCSTCSSSCYSFRQKPTKKNYGHKNFDCSKATSHFPIAIKTRLDPEDERRQFRWIGEDGKEYVTTYKIQKEREAWGYDSEFRCYDYEEEWEHIEEVVSVWVPAKWAVENVDYEVGAVQLRPLEALGSQGFKLSRNIKNLSRPRLGTEWGSHLNVGNKFDPTAEEFHAFYKSDKERLALVEIPWEFIHDYSSLFLSNLSNATDTIEANRQLLVEDIKKCQREEEQEKQKQTQQEEQEKQKQTQQEEQEKQNKDTYKKALGAIRGYRKITKRDKSDIANFAQRARKDFESLGQYKDAKRLARLIASDWSTNLKVGKRIEIGKKRWMVFKEGMSNSSWCAWLICLDSVSEVAFPELCEKDSNRVFRWLNKDFFTSLYNFEQIRLGFWNSRDNRDLSVGWRAGSWDYCGIAVDHFQLPTLADYCQMPDLVKKAIQEVSHDADWWLFTEKYGFFGKKAYYVKASTSIGKVATTRDLSDKKGVHPICCFYPLTPD